jgi:glycosyltransferase involved in cell wall biosynthesis
MKILWIPHTAWHIPQRAHVFSRALAWDHEVHVTDAVADFATPRDYLSLRYLRNFTYRRRQEGRITVHGVPRISPALYVPALRELNSRIFERVVSRIIREHGIDVVVGTHVVPPPKAPRVVFDLFDDNVGYWRGLHRAPGYADEVERTERRYLREADAVVAASTVLQDRARDGGARGPVHHIPNGVDLCSFRLARPRPVRQRLGIPGPLVGSVANHDNVLEIDKLLDAARLLRDTDITLLIAGRGIGMQRAAERIRAENVRNVFLYGFVGPEDAPSLISALDVGLCSYRRTPMDHARSPMRLLMYAAAGVPTVCTDLEEVRRMGLPNVVLVDDHAQALAQGIRAALELPRGRPPQVEAYDARDLVRRYERVLRG